MSHGIFNVSLVSSSPKSSIVFQEFFSVFKKFCCEDLEEEEEEELIGRWED